MAEESKQVRVFLSYARGDDEAFVRRLYDDLTARGFEVWFDRVSMPARELTFYQEIRDAVAACDRLVLVVGPKAVASDYVTQEWRFAYFEADKCVNPIVRLDGVKPSGERSDGYELIPEDLKLLHAEDFRNDSRYAEHLENLARQLAETSAPVGKLVAVPELPPHYRENREHLKALRDLLLLDLRKPVVVTGAAARVGLQGMGGIGKSVLACALARRPEVRRALPDGVFWIALGQEPDVPELQRRLARELDDEALFSTVTEGKEKLRKLLDSRAALLVLDDVWQREHAEAFNVIGPRGRLLLTTRDAGLVTALAARENHYQVQLPTQAEAESILAAAVQVETGQLPAEACQVVEECGRLPLALALCGGMVQGGTPWSDVLDALREHDLQFLSADHPAEDQHANAWKAMDVSIRVLPEEQRDRFAELAVFAVDARVPEAAVVTLWEHTGGLSPREARKLLADFARRSLVQVIRTASGEASSEGRITLHDLLHNFAEGMAAKRFGSSVRLHEKLLDAYRKKCPDGWPSGPNDGYFLQHLLDHMLEPGRQRDAIALLEDLPWLEAKTRAGLVFDLVTDFTDTVTALPDPEPQRRILHLLAEAICRDINFIARHAEDYPQALFQCLWNSCWWYDCPQAAAHYVVPQSGWKEPPPWEQPGPKLYQLLEAWREQRQRLMPGHAWLRSLRPPPSPLASELLAVLRGHSDGVLCVAHSPNRRRVASGSIDRTIRIWDATLTAELRCLCEHEGAVRSLQYSPDGRWIASGSDDGTVVVWDADSGRQVHRFRRNASAVVGVMFSADSSRVGGVSLDRSVYAWDVRTGDAVLHGPPPIGGRFANLPPQIQAAARRRIDWAIEANSWLELGCACPLLSPSGEMLVLRKGHDVHVLPVANSGECLCLTGHTDQVEAAVFSADSSMIGTGSADKTVRVWNAQTGAEMHCFRGHQKPVSCVSFSPDGQRVVSGSFDGTLRIWTTENAGVQRYLHDHGSDVTCVLCSGDGSRLLSGGEDGRVRMWDPMSGTQLACYSDHEGPVLCLCLSPDGHQVVSGSSDKSVVIRNLQTGTTTSRRSGCGPVRAAAFSHDSQHLAIGAGKCFLQIVNVATGKELRTIWTNDQGISNPTWALCFSPDDSEVIEGASDGSVRSWMVKEQIQGISKVVLPRFRGHAARVTRVACTPDGRRVVTASLDGTIRIWDSSLHYHLLETIVGDGDTAAIAAGSDRFPWRAIRRAVETVVESAAEGTPTAWFPTPLEHITTDAANRGWAGASGD